MIRQAYRAVTVAGHSGPSRKIPAQSTRLRVILVLTAAVVCLACPDNAAQKHETKTDIMAEKRKTMVETQIRRRGVADPRVLRALEEVPRHLFVPAGSVNQAYDDHPLFIGHGQTISQPYIVALMSEVLRLDPEDRVLEIGTGSGYQAAILSELVKEVYSIEIIEELGLTAKERLAKLGYEDVEVRIGDGYKGWPEKAPFDAIIVTAAPETVPQDLVDQLADGGRMVIPVGSFHQELVLLEKKDGKIERKYITAVRFVPMVHGDEKPNKGD
jgi:protein-L-isoaspartate(D-aspartate) O-methyltransferase